MTAMLDEPGRDLPSDMDYKDQGRDYESVMKPPEVSYVTDL